MAFSNFSRFTIEITCIVVSLIFIVVFYNSGFFDSHNVISQDGHLLTTLSATIASGTLAYVGIIQVLFLDPARIKTYQRREALKICLDQIEKWIKKSSDDEQNKNLTSLYERSKISWKKAENNLVGLRYANIIFGFISFAFLISSSLLSFLSETIISIIFSMHFLFLGLFFLLSLIWTHSKILKTVESLYPIDPKPRKGNIWIKKINDKYYSPGQYITYDIKDENELEIHLAFEGNITNGFFDIKLNLSNDSYIYYPDSNTYFSYFEYPPNRGRIGVAVVPEYDTGVINGPCTYEDTQTIMMVPIKHQDKQIENTKIYLIPPKVKVTDIEAGIYEDPLFIPIEKPRGAGGMTWTPEEKRNTISRKIIKLI